MVGAVGLDDQPRPAAGEVRDERAEAKLSGEAGPDAGQRTPQHLLGWSRVVAQGAGKMEVALRF